MCDGKIYNLEETKQSNKNVFGKVLCPGRWVFNKNWSGENCEIFLRHAVTPTSNYVYGKCGFWSFDHKAFFMFQEHVKSTKTDKSKFLKTSSSCYPTSNYLLMYQRNIRENFCSICVWTTKCKNLFEMCILQNVKTKSLFTFQPIHFLTSTTKKC